jgi:hypothetical protein
LPAELSSREATEVIVHERHDAVDRARVAVASGAEKVRYLSGPCCRGCNLHERNPSFARGGKLVQRIREIQAEKLVRNRTSAPVF